MTAALHTLHPRIDQLARKYRDALVDITLAICRQRTVNYSVEDYPGAGPDDMPSPGCETRVVNALLPHLLAWQVRHQVVEKVPGRANVVAQVGQGLPSYRSLLVLLHSDTVPSGGAELWDFPPFEPFEKDGKLYGRGVLDNKGPLAAALITLCILKDLQEQLPGTFLFGAVADEEVGGAHCGFEVLWEEGLIPCTDAIIPDVAGEMKTLDVAEKGRVLLRIIAHGLQAHAMHPHKGRNAIVGLAKLLSALEDHEFRFEAHRWLKEPTFNIGLCRGGSAPNNVPARAEAVLDIRTVPGMTSEGIIAEFQALAETLDRRDIRFEFSVRNEVPPTELREDAPILAAIKRFAPEAREYGSGGGTFCKPLWLAGVDAVGWAPGEGSTYHMANEEIEIAQLVTFSATLAKVAVELLTQRA